MGVRNSYQGIDEYAVQCIQYKAKQLVGKAGFTEADRDDLEQEMIFDLLRRLPQFDPARAQRNTFIARVVEHCAATLVERVAAPCRGGGMTFVSFEERMAMGQDGSDINPGPDLPLASSVPHPASSINLAIDLNAAVDQLPEELRRFCEILGSDSPSDARRKAGMSRATFFRRLAEVRSRFQKAGLNQESFKFGEHTMNDITRFNYKDLSPETVGEVQAATERIRVRMKRTTEDIVDIGLDLITVKKKLPHGQFGVWLKTEFDMSQDTAENFMRVAKKFGDQIPKVSEFVPSVLYFLAAPSTPQTVMDMATQKAEAGEKVSLETLKEWKYRAVEAEKKEQTISKALQELNQEKKSLQEKIQELQNQEPNVMKTRQELQHVKEKLDATKSELALVQESTRALETNTAQTQWTPIRFKGPLVASMKKAEIELKSGNGTPDPTELGAIRERILQLVSVIEETIYGDHTVEEGHVS